MPKGVYKRTNDKVEEPVKTKPVKKSWSRQRKGVTITLDEAFIKKLLNIALEK